MVAGIGKKISLTLVTAGSGGGAVKLAVDYSASTSPDLLTTISHISETSMPPPELSSEVDNQISRNRAKRELSEENFINNDFNQTLEGDALKKERIRAEADDILDRLNDYTFKLFTPCGDGTAWILDYILPERPSQKYPLTWYFATNLHVINSFRFPNNLYSQELPKSEQETRELRNRSRGVKHSHLNLYNSPTCNSVDLYGYLDIALSQSSWGPREKADYGLAEAEKIKIPKLFWAAHNFLEKDEALGTNYDHFSDFAVLEIEFTSEHWARKYTNNFADKYGRGKKKPIDVFSSPLESRYSKEELYNLDENFYILAYPFIRGNRWSSTNNFDRKSGKASQLGDGWYSYEDPEKKKYRGFVEAKQIMKKGVVWNGKPLREVGHFYKLNYNPLGLGSSGGVFVDGSGSAVGVTAVTTTNGKGPSWIAPLRSVGIRADEAQVSTPSYDLILGGGERQVSSYKSQLEKFILSKGRQTWLSTRDGWDTQLSSRTKR